MLNRPPVTLNRPPVCYKVNERSLEWAETQRASLTWMRKEQTMDHVRGSYVFLLEKMSKYVVTPQGAFHSIRKPKLCINRITYGLRQYVWYKWFVLSWGSCCFHRWPLIVFVFKSELIPLITKRAARKAALPSYSFPYLSEINIVIPPRNLKRCKWGCGCYNSLMLVKLTVAPVENPPLGWCAHRRSSSSGDSHMHQSSLLHSHVHTPLFIRPRWEFLRSI